MNLTELIEENPWVILLGLAIVGTLWKSYPHMIIAELLPSDEYNNWVLLEVMIREGKAFDLLLSPQLQYYMMFLLNQITGINSITMFRWANGIIGGFSVFSFYYFCSAMLDKRQAIIASTLYTFSEPFFYRSCFLGSTEILGITLMFVMFGLYLRKKYLHILPFTLFSAFIHLAPFVFGLVSIVTPFLLSRKTLPKAALVVVAMVLLIFGPFSPHRKQKLEIFSSATNSISLQNLFIFSLPELLTKGLLSYLGFVALALITLPRIREWNKTEKSLLLISTSFMMLSWIGYNAMIYSPRRMIVYMVIPMLTSIVRFITNPKGLLLIVSLMILSPPLMGTQSFVWVYDSITESELEAIDWLVENNYFAESEWHKWFSDRPITQAINPHIFFFRPDRDPASASVSTQEELEYLNKFVDKIHEFYEAFLNGSESKVEDDFPWNYVIISERMKKRSFYLVRDPAGGTRSKEIRIPTKDVWKDDPRFKEIYNMNGVVIYEKTIN